MGRGRENGWNTGNSNSSGGSGENSGRLPDRVGDWWLELSNSDPMCPQYHLWRKPASKGDEEIGSVPVSYFWMHYSYLINHLEAATLLAYKAHYMVLNC